MGNTTKYGPSSSSDIIYSARKNSAGTIIKGKAVYAVGFSIDGYYVEKAKADNPATMPSVGIVATDLSDVETGSILVSGVLREIDTSSWAVKDELFVSPATAGELTNVKPVGTTDVVEKIGVVIKSDPSDGVIQIYNAGAAVHANRTGGSLHTVASNSEAGFLPQSNFSATTNPTVNDDDSQGYQVGSRWVNLSTAQEFVCVDATSSAAVWKQTTV